MAGSYQPGDPVGLEQLAAEARYHRQRYDLYRAKMYGLRPTSETRLRELERSADLADARLQAAKAGHGGPPAKPAD